MIFSYLLNMQSHPSWVCGLKHCQALLTSSMQRHTLRGCVDWNHNLSVFDRHDWSHTLRGCVDWNIIFLFALIGCKTSHPSWVCGLKQQYLQNDLTKLRSHPSWVCGLKQSTMKQVIIILMSHPSWVCGLKQRLRRDDLPAGYVTPFVGVWIETSPEPSP